MTGRRARAKGEVNTGATARGARSVKLPAWSGEAARRSLKTSEIVALDIVRDIVGQNLKAGDRLPLEAEMLVKYRVSRSSLREALRLLEVQGLIAIRPGPGAGTVDGQVLPGNLARTMTLYLHLSHANYDQLLEAWMLTEPLLGELAAKNPDRTKVRKAMTPFLSGSETCHGPMRHIKAGLAFHDVVTQLAGNPVLELALNAIGFIVTEHVLAAAHREELEDRIVDDHKGIAEAIIAGKPQVARRLMHEHVEHIVEDFRAYWPRKVGEKIQWR